MIGKVLKKGDTVVLETTVPPKTTETRIAKLLKESSGLNPGADFYLAHSPERIMSGFSIERLKKFPKIVGGINPQSTDAAYELYKKFSNISKVSDARTAELVKVSEGIHRDVNIAIANELYKVCKQNDVDFWELQKAASHKYCNIYDPGSVGGHCIPVYPWFLLNDMDLPLTRTARTINDDMIEFYADEVAKITTSGKVAVVGITYRAGVKELAYTRSLPFIELLKKRGYQVFVHDPMFDDDEIRKLGLVPLSGYDDMDAIVLFNKTDEKFSKYKEIIVDVKKSL